MSDTVVAGLIGAVAGALVAGLGWWVAWAQAERTRAREAALRRLERQIGELYGPLLGLITRSRIVAGVKKRLLPTTAEGETGAFRDALDVEVARFFERRYSFPINGEIRRLIAAKLHLLDPPELPASFTAFLEHEAEYDCLHALWRATDGQVRADEGYHGARIVRQRWPDDLEADVRARLAALTAEHRRFLADTAGRARRPGRGAGRDEAR
jgi:type II secretory pathway pseudopilin PulG